MTVAMRTTIMLVDSAVICSIIVDHCMQLSRRFLSCQCLGMCLRNFFSRNCRRKFNWSATFQNNGLCGHNPISPNTLVSAATELIVNDKLDSKIFRGTFSYAAHCSSQFFLLTVNCQGFGPVQTFGLSGLVQPAPAIFQK